jgi:hypothetical protein
MTNPDDIAWVAPRLTDFPTRSLFDKLDIKKHAAERPLNTYIHCTREPLASALKPFAKRAEEKRRAGDTQKLMQTMM